MDFLSGEINKLKRKAPQESDRKYIKRSEIEASRQEEYRKQQEELASGRQSREAERLRCLAEHESAKRKKDSDRALKEQKNVEPDLDAIQADLRALKQPIRYFGEEPADIKKRLDQYKARQEQLTNSTNALLQEVYSDPRDEDLSIDESLFGVDLSLLKTEEEEKRLALHNQIFLLLKFYIKQWDHDVRSSSPDGGESSQVAMQKQAKEHLARLLLRLKTGNLPIDILTNLASVVSSLQQADFTGANRAYLQMSIGKATWPVGVTSVGIHERAQRERQHKKLDSAHILADETTRQWLQSLKRLITYREKRAAEMT
ncbi:protein of unknown function [Taphrina deformans PYCC 5710]|uniref:Pre-mRNA-splicing factor 18 n=1 Tax=Taphrina deformans (strain PYCC 5710 / ATCC 11124 / CBS 356.35 / IMI 108563 / JCM 9778 / NBRC 8474) TaxID=1097556 RepID=R4XH05_TAPDE|nr:protein of unknown function [Taphrina deformans PYCC 5710]|eukprot:CCG85076.1 protein of unknown function [Taphrina deformans PYCC 5710]